MTKPNQATKLTPEFLDLNTSREIKTSVRNLVFKYRGSYKELAAKCELSPQTIRNISYGDTKYPRSDTLQKILIRGFGYQIGAYYHEQPTKKEHLKLVK